MGSQLLPFVEKKHEKKGKVRFRTFPFLSLNVTCLKLLTQIDVSEEISVKR